MQEIAVYTSQMNQTQSGRSHDAHRATHSAQRDMNITEAEGEGTYMAARCGTLRMTPRDALAHTQCFTRSSAGVESRPRQLRLDASTATGGYSQLVLRKETPLQGPRW